MAPERKRNPLPSLQQQQCRGLRLETGDIQARRDYLRAVISQIEVDDGKIRIIGDKATLAAVIAGRQTQGTNVRGFVRKWRARRDSNS
jgi:site-specific DNA recombinase